MHFIKCNRIIISYDPWSWHMRVVGCQGRWIFSRLAACLQSFGARGDSSFDPLLRGAGWKQAIRAWTRWCRCRRQASVTSSCGRMGASQNSAECMSPLFRRKTRETIDKKNKGNHSPTSLCLPSSECSWIQAQISFSGGHAAESAQSFSKQTNEQAKGG